MALELVKIKHVPELKVNVKTISITSNLKLLAVLTYTSELSLIPLSKQFSEPLILPNVQKCIWQEPCFGSQYKLLTVDSRNNLLSYELFVCRRNSSLVEISESFRWEICKLFPLAGSIEKDDAVPLVEILKCEEKELIIAVGRQYVVTIITSATESPEVVSSFKISDNPSVTEILLIEEIIFVLDQVGSKISAFSLSRKLKLLEVDVTVCSFREDIGSIKCFACSTEMDNLAIYTSSHKIYWMNISVPKNEENIPRLPCLNVSHKYTVTAFTKKLPSVKQLNDNSRGSMSGGRDISYLVDFHCDKCCNLLDMTLHCKKLYFLLSCGTSYVIGVKTLDHETETVFKRVESPIYIVKVGLQVIASPILILFENCLSLLCVQYQPKTFVNELMIYPCSSAAEEIALLNNWQDIEIDIEVLKLGLRNRQLDTVIFFLKAHEQKFFQEKMSCQFKGLSVNSEAEVYVWNQIINLLLEHVNHVSADVLANQFVEQILQAIVSTVIHLINIEESTSMESAEGDYDKSCTPTCCAFVEFIHRVRKVQLGRSTLVDLEPNNHLSQQSIDQSFDYYYDSFRSLEGFLQNPSNEDIMENAIFQGDIPTAMSFIIRKQPSSFQNNIDVHEMLIKFGMKQVFKKLKEGHLSEAKVALSNMGFPIYEKLLHILRATADQDIRRSLIVELRSKRLLTVEDEKNLKFVTKLESFYPCASFEQRQQLLNLNTDLDAEKTHEFSDPVDVEFVVGDIIPKENEVFENGPYCCIALNWISYMDDATRCRILIPCLLEKGSIFELDMPPEIIWYYLLENGKIEFLQELMQTWLEMKQQSNYVETSNKWHITDKMLNLAKEVAPIHIAETVLNEFARHGIFCKEELEDVTLLLQRMGHSQCSLNYTSIAVPSDFTPSTPLYYKIIEHCLNSGLFNFVYKYFSNDLEREMLPFFDGWNASALQTMMDFDDWLKNKQDFILECKAMVSLAQFIYSLPDQSIKTILSQIPHPMNIALLLFLPGSLSSALDELDQLKSDSLIPSQSIKVLSLLSDLVSTSENDMLHEDISVYQLLQGNSLFDPTRLFGWQAGNTIKNGDSYSEIPHFSLKSLSDQYGMKEDVTFLFYLKGGWPHLAFLKFMVQEARTQAPFTNTKLKSVCSQAFHLGISNYRNVPISSACVTFMEILGQKSLDLRICLIAANLIHQNFVEKHGVNAVGNESLVADISSMFKASLNHQESAVKLVEYFKEVSLSRKPITDIKSPLDGIIQWIPLMILSNFYEVDVSESYLQKCAENDDWLGFLLFAQIYQIDKQQVTKLLPKFSNPFIGNHILKSLEKKYPSHSSKSERKVFSRNSKDIKKSLYAMVGVIKPNGPPQNFVAAREQSEENSDSVASDESTTSVSSNSEKNVFHNDLIGQILESHRSETPWSSLLQASYIYKNPVLALLAASYPDAKLLNCYATWLVAVTSPKIFSLNCEPSEALQMVTSWSVKDLNQCILLSMKEFQFFVLLQGFQFFLPNSPLVQLMEFLVSFFMYKKIESSGEKLTNFQRKLWDYSPKDMSSSSLHSLEWIEEISVDILKEAAINCCSNYERQLFLQYLCFSKIESSFSKLVTVPTFSKLDQLIHHLEPYEEFDDVGNLLLPVTDSQYIKTCWKVVKNLQECHQYDKAVSFSKVAGLRIYEVLLFQLEHKLKDFRETEEWEDLTCRIEFWKTVISDMINHSDLHSHLIKYLMEKCYNSNRYSEKYCLAKLVFELLVPLVSNRDIEIVQVEKTSSYNGEKKGLDEFQSNMWTWCIKAQVQGELSSDMLGASPTNLCDIVHLAENFEVGCPCSISEVEMEALEKVTGHFLKNKDFKSPVELATIFGYLSVDLRIVMASVNIARGVANPADVCSAENLNISSLNFNATDEKRRLVYSWTQTMLKAENTEDKFKISVLEKLARKTDMGSSLCNLVLVYYSISQAINENFYSVAKESNPFTLIKSIWSLGYSDKITLAKSLITVHSLTDEDIASFFSNEIWLSLSSVSDSNDGFVKIESPSIHSSEPRKDFQMMMKLCNDSSILGKKLLDKVNSVMLTLVDTRTDHDLYQLVDACVCAHDSFTEACYMEGISRILRLSRTLILMLADWHEFSLLVRLFTGIGRCCEMSYVFDILQKHQKFESLFAKGTEKMPGLKLALLDYLMRHPSTEVETMLVLYFSMFRERAEMIEASVNDELSYLGKRNSEIGLKYGLEKVLGDLSEAADNYCKAECFGKALKCAKQAELVALQIFLLPSGTWIINLDEPSVKRCIMENGDFSQALIIAEAYKHQQSWGHALFYNVVNKGNWEYLKSFQVHFRFSETLIEEAAQVYFQHPTKNEQLTKNMEKLLSFCPALETKYRLAKTLGFEEMALELLLGNEGCYLQDLIANKKLR